MPGDLHIRESSPDDDVALDTLYPASFPDEDLLPVVHELLPRSDVLSLVATSGGRVVGHVMFTMCGVERGDVRAALLAPLAVAPASQRKGVGSAVVRDGLDRLLASGIEIVLVLGDPAYYGRFGFEPERAIETPLPIPAEWRDAWQSLAPGDRLISAAGKLSVPQPWNQPALWAP